MGFVIGCVGMIIVLVLYAAFQFLHLRVNQSNEEILESEIKLLELRRQELDRKIKR